MRQLQITPLDGYDPEIGRWMWALQDVRRRYTLRLIKLGLFSITSLMSKWADSSGT